MKALRLFVLACALSLCSACAWQPFTYNEETQEKVESALNAFRAENSLQSYFEEAIAYAIFPAALRAGTGFGGAYANGWLFERGEVTGRAMLVELFAGANLGAQGYRQIVFFHSEDTLDQFKRGRFEFTGQANTAHLVGGKSVTPAYHPEVALFVQVKGGLLLEASVGTQRYDFFPLQDKPRK